METLRPSLQQSGLLRVLEVTQKLAAPFDLEHMLTEVVDAAVSVLGADRGTLWLYEAASHELVIKVPALSSAPRASADDGLIGECLTGRNVINVDDCEADPRFRGAMDRATGYKTRSVLNMPLVGLNETPVGVLQLHNKLEGNFTDDDEKIAAALAAQCAVALQRAKLTEDLIRKERLDEEVTVAREIQVSTLPTEMPAVAGYDVAGLFRPTDQTGGDMFDLVMIGTRLFMLMGDATGHGFGPALSATQMQAMLRVSFRLGADLSSAFAQVNNQLAEDLPDDRFITAFIGFLDPDSHLVNYHAAGQGPIVHYHAAERRCEWHQPSSFPLGVLEIDEPGPEQELTMAPGDILGLISDGIYEYQSEDGEMFGEDRVAAILEMSEDVAMSGLADQLLAATRKFGGSAAQADDMTIVLIRRQPAVSA